MAQVFADSCARGWISMRCSPVLIANPLLIFLAECDSSDDGWEQGSIVTFSKPISFIRFSLTLQREIRYSSCISYQWHV